MGEEFIQRTAGGLAVRACPTNGNSTLEEWASVKTRMQRVSARSRLIVTSDYHTRRALSIARKVYPSSTWSVAAVDNGLLSVPRWWTSREIVKNVALEWQKLLWWELVERHK